MSRGSKGYDRRRGVVRRPSRTGSPCPRYDAGGATGAARMRAKVGPITFSAIIGHRRRISAMAADSPWLA